MVVSTNSAKIDALDSHHRPVRILVDTVVDEGLTNAQITNAREIIARLNPARFHVTTFFMQQAHRTISSRPNTRLIKLPARKQSLRLLREFVFGRHQILFYVKASPASKLYLRMHRAWKHHCITIGTVESQSDLRNEPTVAPETIALWEQTVLRCDFLYSNSNAVRKSLEAEYALPSEVVETGVDTKFFVPGCERTSKPSRTRVLFVGSLRPFKQPDLLLQAAQHFPSADFAIAGSGMMAEELSDRVRRQNLTNVFLLGSLGENALREQYQQAHIFLFPSKWEGSPKVILEAAACGLPVLARKDYNPETVVDGETGYLVRDDAELYARLRALIEDPNLRQTLGTAGRLHAEKFDWDLINLKWESIFSRLASQERMAG